MRASPSNLSPFSEEAMEEEVAPVVAENPEVQPGSSAGTSRTPPKSKKKKKKKKHLPMAALSLDEQEQRRVRNRLAQSAKRRKRAEVKRELDISTSSAISAAERDGMTGTGHASAPANPGTPPTHTSSENSDTVNANSRGRSSVRGRADDLSGNHGPTTERSLNRGNGQSRARGTPRGRGIFALDGNHRARGSGSGGDRGSRENRGSSQNRSSRENRGPHRGSRRGGSRGDRRPDAAQVYRRGEVQFTLSVRRVGAEGGVVGEIHRILALVPEDYEISGLRHTGADQAAFDAHDESSVGVVTTALTGRGFEVNSTPVWSRHSMIVPTNWCTWEERADVVTALLIRNQKHGLPERSLRYVSSTQERDSTTGTTKVRLWLDASPEAVNHIESRKQLLDTGVGKVVKLTPHRVRHRSDHA